MIDFNNLIVDRLIIHTIIAKQEGADTATIEHSNEITQVDHQGLEIIRTRLIDSAGKHSKAFELEIEKIEPGSFYALSRYLSDENDDEFIRKSIEIGELLCESQTRTSIPGGYMLLLDCLDNESNLPLVIVIKAEPHEALQFSNNQNNTRVDVLEKVFLSPSQKLYKIGIIYHETEDTNPDNIIAKAFLYDDQFRAESHPAEYFYKDFLGFSIGTNGKIQTQRFYEKSSKFIKKKISNYVTRANLLSALKNEFRINQNATISPINFARTFITTENGIRDQFISTVCNELPSTIVKDNTLINNQINSRKIDFPSNIKLQGPEIEFDARVAILTDQSQLEGLVVNDPLYTIIKITGKPYSTNEQ